MVSPSQDIPSGKNRFLDSLKIYWQWPVLFDVIFAASVSLILFERLLDFFLTPTINKIFVFLSLFAFFFLLFLFFITPNS